MLPHFWNIMNISMIIKSNNYKKNRFLITFRKDSFYDAIIKCK